MADSTKRGFHMRSEGCPSVAVIIAAYNVAETIGKAVTSALREPETAEVVVVDDASQDGTAEAAHEAANGDDRLSVVRNATNLGPSRSRNLAISMTKAPFISILDGDDFFIEGRFKRIFSTDAWDLCADNIAFFSSEETIEEVTSLFLTFPISHIDLKLSAFILGNIPNRKQPRAELGFLKPVMRRSFIEAKNLQYDEACRLGEDFIFYVRALASGAVYRTVPQCGYAALVRNNSLSGQHDLHDLKALHDKELELAMQLDLSSGERDLLLRRAGTTLRRVHHREVLAKKATHGRFRALASAAMRPTSLIDIGRDRWRKAGLSSEPSLPRPLLTADYFKSQTLI